MVESRPLPSWLTMLMLAVNVSTLLPVVGFIPNDAVTPLGRLAAERLTLPVNPFSSFTVTVATLEVPETKVREADERTTENVGVGAAVTVR
jgi:hypothetical protein